MTPLALIFGVSGQVGTALQRTAPRAWAVVGHDSHSVDIRDATALARTIAEARPSAVINCAAFTRVDDAERQPDEAFAVNAHAPGVIAELCRRAGARYIHLSTDYVFDGSAHKPYALDATPNPINVYGASKLEGERRVFAANPASVIVRTAWVHAGVGSNFVKTAVRLLTAGTTMKVVDDQIGTPTRADHLARALWRVAERSDIPRLIHFTDAGVASWFDVATAVLEQMRDCDRLPEGAAVVPTSTDCVPRPARRPAFAVLDKRESWRAIGFTPPHWREGIIASTTELLNA